MCTIIVKVLSIKPTDTGDNYGRQNFKNKWGVQISHLLGKRKYLCRFQF